MVDISYLKGEMVAMDRELTKLEKDAQDEMRIVCRSWIECPPLRRPTPAALGQRIAEIAAQLTNGTH